MPQVRPELELLVVGALAVVASVVGACAGAVAETAAELPTGVSVSTGAGWSPSGWPGVVASIQCTTEPSEYVWSALNATEPVAGSGPRSTGNCWNWPGLIALAGESAVQTISP